MRSRDALDSLSAAELLRMAEDLLGCGGRGDTPMRRLAQRAADRARETGDAESEALAQFYLLVGQVDVLPEADMTARIAQARRLCESLGV